MKAAQAKGLPIVDEAWLTACKNAGLLPASLRAPFLMPVPDRLRDAAGKCVDATSFLLAAAATPRARSPCYRALRCRELRG